MNTVILDILEYLLAVISATFYHVLLLFGPGILLGIIIHFLSEYISNRALSLMGIRIYLYTFGWLGIAVHEIGHAIFCLLFGLRITSMRLFTLNPDSESMGHVEYTYNPNNIFHSVGQFFFGIGPIIFGVFIIYMSSYYLMGSELFSAINTFSINTTDLLHLSYWGDIIPNIWDGLIATLSFIVSDSHFSNWHFYLFIYLVFSVGSAMSLSPSDIGNMLRGLKNIVLLILLFNISTLWIGDFAVTSINSIINFISVYYIIQIYSIIIMVIISIIIVLLPTIIIAGTRRR